MATRATEAAKMIAGLVPGATTDHGAFRELRSEEFARLSTGERAAYELATDLYCGSSAISRFCAFADQRFAGVLLGALTVALGDRLVPVDEGVTVLRST